MSKQPKNEAELLPHEADGIREYDNALPGWWLMTFYITIAFAIPYFLYYQFGNGPTLVQEYEKEAQKAAVAAEAAKPKFKEPNAEELAAIMASPERRKQGSEVFKAQCLPCHGALGQGGIGPNLTDNFWINGGKPEQMVVTVKNGVLEKGMPNWEPVLSPDEIYSAVAFVKSLRGTHPAGGKAPQGVEEKE